MDSERFWGTGAILAHVLHAPAVNHHFQDFDGFTVRRRQVLQVAYNTGHARRRRIAIEHAGAKDDIGHGHEEGLARRH